jgi:hypothetical protein
MRQMRSLLPVFLITIMIHSSYAQTSCVNYDSRYPITTSTGKKYLWNPLWNFYNMKQKKISGLNIGGNNMFNGLMQYVPSSYYLYANRYKKYPVIISFHGFASRGFGTTLELCRLFKDRGGDSAGHKTLPGRVERSTSHLTQYYNGIKYEYIVISPQFNKYTRLQSGVPDNFPTAKDVENVINYVVSRFRIDPRRIYLTGYSNGANMVLEYAASSVTRARRVAAIMPISLCSQHGHPNNTSKGYYAKNIGLAKLKTWFVYCESDNCGTGPALNVPNKWVDSIMKVPGHARPRYTRLRNINPPTLYNCSDSLWHDAWSRAFDPNFKASHYYKPTLSVGANDGINLNMYQWFIRQVNTATTSLTSSSVLDEPEIGDDQQMSVSIGPNPFVSSSNVRLDLVSAGVIYMSVIDVTGKLVYSQSHSLSAGSNIISLNMENSKSGIYMLRITGKNFSSVHKIVKK